nr:hypothetical protein [Tanacetum cinerariifolium]
MDSDVVHMVAALKVPMLKLGEFKLWRIRIDRELILPMELILLALRLRGNGSKVANSMITTRARIFLKNTGRKLNLIGNDSVAFDKTKLKCYNSNKRGHFVRECRAPMGHENKSRDVTRRTVSVKTPNSSALVSCDGLRGYDWSDQAEEGPTNYALMAYSTSSTSFLDFEIIECQIIDNYTKGLGYNAVPPPHTGMFSPSKSDLSYTGLEELLNEPKTKKSKDKSNDVEPESVRKGSEALIIED